jgi:glycosyltransferase involved in cell wall biosynthesis
MNRKLSIAIPTYNRETILCQTIDFILEEVIANELLIYIVDDSNNNITCEIIKKKYANIPNIIYSKNVVNLGHDKNFFKTISIIQEQFVWYLGDSMFIKKGIITKILNIINSSDYDFIVLNEDSRRFSLKDNLFIDYASVLNKIGWHLTMSGVTIYNSKTLKKFHNSKVDLYKNFPQLALIVDYIYCNNFKLLWINEKCLFGNKGKISYWNKNVFDVFINDLETTLLNIKLPAEIINKIIKDHSFYTQIFGINKLIKYRSEGFYDIKKFQKFKSKISIYTDTNLLLAFIVSMLNKRILRFLLKFIA